MVDCVYCYKMSSTHSDSTMDGNKGVANQSEESALIQRKMGAPGTPGDLTGRLVLAIFTASLGMFQFGYNTGVINAPRSVMEDFYNETYISREGEDISDDLLNVLWSFTVASFAVGGMIGGILGAWWADKFGRKKGMLLNTGFGILAALLMGLSKLAGSYEMVIIGRFFVGFNCGLYTGLTPLYNSEIAPVNLRGAIGTVNQLAVTIGMLISQVFGLGEIMGTDDLWPLLLGLTILPPLFQIVLLQFIPESPRYTLLTKGDEDATLITLQVLRGKEDVQSEMEEMVREKVAQENEKTLNMLEIFKVPALRMPLIIAITMHLSQQFSGIVCIFYYSTSLFENVGLSAEQASYATTSVGGIMVVMTLVSIPLMDRLGRKTLHLGGLSGMFVLSIVFTIAFHQTTQTDEEWLEYFTISAALCIVVFFAVGPGSIPWMIVAELFPQGSRASAVNIGVLVNWVSNFIVSVSFPFLQEALEELVFVPFTVLLLLFIVVLFKILPETKGKTIEQISLMFSQDLATMSSKAKTEDMGTDGVFTTL